MDYRTGRAMDRELAILEEQYENGEISRKEYEAAIRDIERGADEYENGPW